MSLSTTNSSAAAVSADTVETCSIATHDSSNSKASSSKRKRAAIPQSYNTAGTAVSASASVSTDPYYHPYHAHPSHPHGHSHHSHGHYATTNHHHVHHHIHHNKPVAAGAANSSTTSSASASSSNNKIDTTASSTPYYPPPAYATPYTHHPRTKVTPDAHRSDFTPTHSTTVHLSKKRPKTIQVSPPSKTPRT